jgi:myosin heavy subunit
MLIRISLIIALVAGLAVAGLNIFKVREKVTTLVNERNSERGQKEQAQSDLAQTRTDLDKTKSKLKQTEDELASTKTERDKAVDEAAVQIKKATDLADTLAKATKDRDDAQAYLARYKQSGFEPEQLTTLAKQMKQLQDFLDASIEEKKVLQHQLVKTENELKRYTVKDYPGPDLPANLKGKILVSDPKWDFVIINVGEDQGMLQHGELLVSRDGKLVAKLVVTAVQKDRAVANLLPNWPNGLVIEGDIVTPAHPAS